VAALHLIEEISDQLQPAASRSASVTPASVVMNFIINEFHAGPLLPSSIKVAVIGNWAYDLQLT